MDIRYSKEPFDGYTHRFVVRFKVDNDWRNDSSIDLYTNSDSSEELAKFIDEKKSAKVLSYIIEHRASKEQDEANSEFLKEFFQTLDSNERTITNSRTIKAGDNVECLTADGWEHGTVAEITDEGVMVDMSHTNERYFVTTDLIR